MFKPPGAIGPAVPDENVLPLQENLPQLEGDLANQVNIQPQIPARWLKRGWMATTCILESIQQQDQNLQCIQLIEQYNSEFEIFSNNCNPMTL